MIATIEQLKDRIELFRKNFKDYKSKNYDEYNTRADFIDVMFSSLGWDMYNEQKIIEQFREVVREDKIIIDGNKKAPDYSFRIGPHIVFYVEAKKPSVDVKNDMTPALQLRRYAHTRGLALSIVTDFEEVAVYDTRIKPDKKDSAAVARVFYCTYDELFLPSKIEGYETNYDFLLNTFGKQAVLNGSFNRYVETNKKGTTSVDKGFLELLNKWREKLAENIALKNDETDEYNLNIAVQKLIDRLIFLRIAEDRQIEKPDLLFEITHKENVYTSLNNIFALADLKYNSNLFSSEAWMVALNIEDKVLDEIIDEMYPPKCPYEFSVLPIEILGHAYEQFLGKTIKFSRKTKFGHSIEIEEKPEVRKAGGVYYTPDYIVDYIVENTVGEKLNPRTPSPRTPGGGKASKGAQPLTPEEIASLKILDPACGSGSFLIGAYDYLIRYHLEYYLKNNTRRDKSQSAGIIYEVGEGKYKLSTKTKSEILVNNIFGVDIDPQAVEVTKLSLLLKVLEDENLEYKEKLFKTEQLHMLPDLSANIKCGNSLIGSDYYADKNMEMFGSTEMRKVNVFDWEKEFLTSPPGPLSSKRGGDSDWGFDCVIGNPPYVRQELLSESKEYFQNHYSTFQGTADLYVCFMEKGYNLLKRDGLFSYIVANKWMRANYAKGLRAWLSKKDIAEIIDFGDLPVFQQATTYPCIFKIRKSEPSGKISAVNVDDLNFASLGDYVKGKRFDVAQDRLSVEGWHLTNTAELDLLEKIKSKGIPLEQYVEGKIFRGVLTGYNEAFVIDEATKEKLINEDPNSAEIIKPFLAGRDIKRYASLETDKFLILFKKGWTKSNGGNDRNAWRIFSDNYPAIAEYLKQYEEQCAKRYDKGDYWWELRTCDYYDEFEKDKIIIPAISNRANNTLDKTCCYSNDKTTIVVHGDSKYLLGIMNSKLSDFYIQSIASTKQGGYFEYKPMYVSSIPVVENGEVIHDKIVQLVDSILDSQNRFISAKSDSDRKVLQQKIDAVDSQIDRLVYELYGLTEDEIRIVEGGN
ncbi:MAG TPA: TaqI-like C-terminal specificity domain-containing protein [Spirochaetota bacterium]|nr:TaqI-like C-terminal specificity domain-containing protein [Spirochaetota bacterium]